MSKLLIIAMAVVALSVSAAETKKPFEPVKNVPAQKEPAKWIDSVTLAPVGAVKTVDLTGRSEWGFGLDAGVGVNPFVSLHVVNLAFEGPGQTVHSSDFTKANGSGDGSFTTGPNSWGGTAIDETDLLVKAKISRFSTESLSLYGIGGGLHEWSGTKRWGLSAGLGLELAFNKHFSVAGDYSVRMYSEADAKGSSLDSLLRALVNFRF